MIWNQPKECMSPEDKRRMQGERLRKMVERVYHAVPFYRQRMQEMDIAPRDIRSIDDIVHLPFTTKQDLRDNYPYGLFAVPMSEIVRLHASSGTTGKPTVVGYTRGDLAVWSEMTARCLTAFGADRHDIVSVGYGYGLFTGGVGLHYGVEHLGGTVSPPSSGNTAKHIMLMHDFGATALACTPSYALYLADALRDSGMPREEFRLRTGIFGAEPWTENMRREIEAKLGIDAYNIYGLSEIMGPGMSYECKYKTGSHIGEDHFYPEIISPDTLESLPYGEQGELVFTHLTKEGMPLLRYRTKDLCSLDPSPCECGRTAVRMSRIVGRSDDMLIIRGVNLFPSQVESVILEMEEFEPHYMLVVDRVGNLDTLEVQVEVRDGFYSDEINRMMELRRKIAARLQSVLGLAADIRLVEPGTIARSEGKARRVIDKRKLN
jgi:phenylacetate-CoA ligase